MLNMSFYSTHVRYCMLLISDDIVIVVRPLYTMWLKNTPTGQNAISRHPCKIFIPRLHWSVLWL